MTRAAASGAGEWRSLEDPAPLLALIADRLYPGQPPDPMVVASVAFQTVTKHLVGLASQAGAPPVCFGEISWRRTSGGIELRSEGSSRGPGTDEPTVVGDLMVHGVAPWLMTIRAHARVAARLLWANATASVLYATTRPGAPAAFADRSATVAALRATVSAGLLATLHAPGALPAFRRHACCLIDRAPGHQRCDECPLRPPRLDRATSARQGHHRGPLGAS